MRLITAVVVGLTVVTACLHVAGYRLLRDSFWGVHVYGFFPVGVLVSATIALALVTGYVAFQRPAPSGGGPPPKSSPGARRRELIVAALVSAAALPVFWLFRTRHAFLGDGFSLMIDLPRGVDFDPNHPLTYFLQHHFFNATRPWFGSLGENGVIALLPPALGSCLLGVFFVFAAKGIAGELLSAASRENGSTPRPMTEWLLAALLACQGFVQIFFGYVENYSFYLCGAAFYLLASLRYLAGRGSLFTPLALLMLGIGFHLSAATLIPSAVVLVAWSQLDAARRRASRLSLALAVLALVVLVLLLDRLGQASVWYGRPYSLLGQIIDSGLKVVTGSEEALGAAAGSYLVSWRHVRDFLNEQLLIGPLALFIFIPGLLLLVSRRKSATARDAFLATAGVSYLATCLIAGDSNLGFARNWDLLAASGLVFSVAGLGILMTRLPIGELRRPIAIALAVSVYHVAPWVLLNASFDRGLERFSRLPLGGGRVESTLSTWYWNTQEFEQASHWSRRAIDTNPQNTMALRNLGMIAMMDHDCVAAAESFKRAIELRPDKLDYRERLAGALLCNARHAEALPHLAYLVEHRPDDARSWIRYGRSLSVLGHNKEARDAAETAQQIEPSGESRELLATTYVGEGDRLSTERRWRDARTEYERSLEYLPDVARTHSQIGVTLANEGHFAEALRSFERSLRIQPDAPEVLFNAGSLLEHLKDPAGAREYWRRALDASNDPEVTARIEQALAALEP